MLIIADNITTRDREVARVFQELKAAAWSPAGEPAQALQRLAKSCIAAGADTLEIDIQQHHDRPEAMESAVNIIQQVTDRQLCLSTNNAEALEAGLRACKRFPLVNYISLDEARLQEMLPMAARYGAEIVLLASDPAAPTDAREMLGKAAVLIGAANEVGIPNSRILIDPGLIHVTHDIGQRHFVEARELLGTLPEAFEPPVRGVCWLGNASSGAPKRLRPVIETAALAVLSAAGLSSVFMDVLRPENMQMARLIKILNNEAIYSDSDLQLQPAPKSPVFL